MKLSMELVKSFLCNYLGEYQKEWDLDGEIKYKNCLILDRKWISLSVPK